MGGRGVFYNTRRHPERYAAGLAFVAGIEPLDSDWMIGNREQGLLTNLPGMRPIAEVFNPAEPISETERDMVLTKVVSGRNDLSDGAGWSAKRVAQYRDLNDAGYGHQVLWDERSHGNWQDAHWDGSPKITVQRLTAYRRNQSFPAFFNDDHDAAMAGRQPEIGNGDPLDGAPWGTWAGYYEWELETIEDRPSSWGATLSLTSESAFENDVPTFDTATADVAIRRPQKFKPAAGSDYDWELTPLNGGAGQIGAEQSGSGTVRDDGVVIVEGLTISKNPGRLTVTSRAPAVSGALNAAAFEALIAPGAIVSVFGRFSATSPRSQSIPLDTN
jgi:hypothetical protein